MQHSLLAQIFARDPRKLARFPDVPLDQALVTLQHLLSTLEELSSLSVPPPPPVLATMGSMPPVVPVEETAPIEAPAPAPAPIPEPAAVAAPAPAVSSDAYLDEFGGSMAALATQVWRARNRIIDPETGEPREEMRRLHRHVEGAFEALREMGLVINDWLKQPYDSGLPVKVLTFQPASEVQRDTVLEATRPTVIWKERLLQMGEVIVGIPPSQSTEAPPP
ncbi:MAG: hypothetical protein QM715_14320 [Nibricoccus sp.]